MQRSPSNECPHIGAGDRSKSHRIIQDWFNGVSSLEPADPLVVVATVVGYIMIPKIQLSLGIDGEDEGNKHSDGDRRLAVVEDNVVFHL